MPFITYGKFGRPEMLGEPSEIWRSTEFTSHEYIYKAFGFGYTRDIIDRPQDALQYEANVSAYMRNFVSAVTFAWRYDRRRLNKSQAMVDFDLPVSATNFMYPRWCYNEVRSYMWFEDRPTYNPSRNTYVGFDAFSAAKPIVPYGLIRLVDEKRRVYRAVYASLHPRAHDAATFAHYRTHPLVLASNGDVLFMTVPCLSLVGPVHPVFDGIAWQTARPPAATILMGMQFRHRVNPDEAGIRAENVLTFALTRYARVFIGHDYIDIISNAPVIQRVRIDHRDSSRISTVNRWYYSGRFEFRIRCTLYNIPGRTKYFDLIVTDLTKPVIYPDRRVLRRVLEKSNWKDIEWLFDKVSASHGVVLDADGPTVLKIAPKVARR